MNEAPVPLIAPASEGRLGIMLAGLGDLATTFIGGVLLIRKGMITAAGSVTQMDAGWLAAGAGLPPARLGPLLGLPSIEDLAFGSWSIFPDSAAEVAQVWTLFEPAQFEAVAEELAEVRPAKAVFNAHEVTDGSSGTYIKIMPNKAALAEALSGDMNDFEKRHACRTVVLFCGSPESPKTFSAAHASEDAFEAGLRNSDPQITSSQIYAWACAKRGTPFACAIGNHPIGFPAIEKLANSTGTPLAGNGLPPVSYRVLDVVSPTAHAPGAEAPCWWPEPLRPEMSAESRESHFGDALAAARASLPIEAVKRTDPALLDVALLLDAAGRRGWSGTQRWMDVFFSAPLSARTPEQQTGDFRENLIRMMKEPAAGPRRM